MGDEKYINGAGEMKYPDYEGWADDNRHRFVAVDDMPHDGTNHQRNSPYLIRRREQTKLLREMWANFWPDYPPLTTQEAKRLLNAGGNWSEEVLDAAAHGASYQHRGENIIKTPVQYILEILGNDLKTTPETEQSENSILSGVGTGQETEKDA